MKNLFPAFVIAAALAACSPSTDSVAAGTKGSMQNTLDAEPTLKLMKLRLVVEKVDVVHKAGNAYEAIATLSYKGKVDKVSLDITADGNNLIWKTDPGAINAVAGRLLAADALAKK